MSNDAICNLEEEMYSVDLYSQGPKLYQAPEKYCEINMPIWDTVANVVSYVGKPFSWVSNFYGYLSGRAANLKELPPSAPGHSWLGHVPELWWKYKSSLMDYLSAYQDTYGYKGISNLQMGPFNNFYVVSDPKMAREILQNSKAFPRGRSYEIWQKFSKRGLGEGDYTQEKRRQADNAIGNAHYGYFFPSIKIVADNWMARLKQFAYDEVAIDLMKECKRATLAALGESLFKHNAHDPNETNPFNLSVENDKLCNKFIDAFQTLFALLTKKFTSPIGRFENIFNFLNPAEAKKFQKAKDTLEKILDELFHKLLDHPETLDRDSKFCALMKTFGIDIDNPDYGEMRNESVAFLLAAFETSSKGISWALYALAMHPDIQDELYNKLHEAFDKEPPQSKADLDRVPLLMQVIEEALRLFAPFPFLLRDIKDSSKFKSFQVQANSFFRNSAFVISPYLIHRNPEYWGEDAHEFKPERWKTGRRAASSLFEDSPGGISEDLHTANKEKEYDVEEDMLSDRWQRQHPEYMSFLGGIHLCPGRFFAKQEIGLLLATLLLEFKVSLAPHSSPVQLKFCITTESENPIYVYLIPR